MDSQIPLSRKKDGASLLGLPVELRLQIFEFALKDFKPKDTTEPSLLLTCKLIRSEAWEQYFRRLIDIYERLVLRDCKLEGDLKALSKPPPNFPASRVTDWVYHDEIRLLERRIWYLRSYWIELSDMMRFKQLREGYGIAAWMRHLGHDEWRDVPSWISGTDNYQSEARRVRQLYAPLLERESVSMPFPPRVSEQDWANIMVRRRYALRGANLRFGC